MSRDCEDALANLYNYLDDELDGGTVDRIRAHLGDCPDCDRPFDFEVRLREVIRAKLDEEIPQAMIVRIQTILSVEHGGGTG